MTRCALYRHFDADEILLYIGISEIPIDRTRSHGLTSVWMPFIDTMTAKWYGSRLEAMTVEREAIANEEPLFNIQYANYDHQPAIDYLEKHTFKVRHVKVLGVENALDYIKRTEWPKNVKFPIKYDL